MAKTHNLGFPRIGDKRELKFALESYWQGAISQTELEKTAKAIRDHNWKLQSDLDWVPVGDFSLYDQVLDMSFTLGNLPERVTAAGGSEHDQYFRLARGRSVGDKEGIEAGEMTKWFDTNYHFIVPEIFEDTHFALNADRLLAQIEEAANKQVNAKPVLIGPVTYLYLCKQREGFDRLDLLPQLLLVYQELLQKIESNNVQWVQIDEPILVLDIDSAWQQALVESYDALAKVNTNILLTTYFGSLKGNLDIANKLPVAGLHINAINNEDEVAALIEQLDSEKVVSLGVIDGRNIWKSDLNKRLDFLETIADKLGDRLWLAPTCSLLHVPINLSLETNFDKEVKNWLAFATEKLEELNILSQALNAGREPVAKQLNENRAAIDSRRNSSRVTNTQVQDALKKVSPDFAKRQSVYDERVQEQAAKFDLPIFPTTTIGSFPQTQEIRQARLAFKRKQISIDEYQKGMKAEIEYAVQAQEKLGLDVLVHGEAERNDMVEYFGQQLEGYAFSEYAWVQSYGSRCVKPPILFGDIDRPNPMTVEWIKYAQSLTSKPLKGMLTGPVTILNWSFVRDDQPRKESCLQLALAIRKEVLDLEAAGIGIIQIDEAALREGLPLRKSEQEDYLNWAVECFRITANGVKDETQIHTHMCYSDFNEIIESIVAMDADVISIETSRSNLELLEIFEEFNYPNEIGPGVYDIHSPNIPSAEQVVGLIERAAKFIPPERLWINPDCGLKTRRWEEVTPALENMVKAAEGLRETWA